MEASSQTSSMQSRALVTAAAAIAMLAGFRILLPGVDAGATQDFVARFGVGPVFSIFTLGVMPILTIAFVIEVVKLVFPRLRIWERASQRNATVMQRIWFVGSMAMAAAQAYGAAGGMLQAAGLVPDPKGFLPIALATLVGSTAFLFWLSLVVARRGLVNGLWLLFAIQMIASAPRVSKIVSFDLAATPAAIWVVAAWALAVIVLAIAGARVATERDADRAGDLIWPAIVGYYAAGMAQAAAILAGAEFVAGRIPHLLMFAALSLLVAMMRAPEAEAAESARARLTLTLLQVVAVAAGSIALAAIPLPFAINPIAVVVTAAVAQTIVQNTKA